MAYDFVSGDTGSRLLVTCVYNDTGLPMNLSGASVKLNYITNTGAAYTKTMTILDAVAGTVEYRFTTIELNALSIEAEVQITDNAGGIVTSLDSMILTIRPQLG